MLLLLCGFVAAVVVKFLSLSLPSTFVKYSHSLSLFLSFFLFLNAYDAKVVSWWPMMACVLLAAC
jgi:hypothetical protein